EGETVSRAPLGVAAPTMRLPKRTGVLVVVSKTKTSRRCWPGERERGREKEVWEEPGLTVERKGVPGGPSRWMREGRGVWGGEGRIVEGVGGGGVRVLGSRAWAVKVARSKAWRWPMGGRLV